MTALLERPAWDPVPESLDGIIRRNRDLVRLRLRLPTEAEVAGVRGAVKRGRPLLTLSPWWLAAIDVADHEGDRHVRLVLVGGTKQGKGWVSSEIRTLDDEAGFVRTTHRLYRVLGPRSIGEPGHGSAWRSVRSSTCGGLAACWAYPNGSAGRRISHEDNQQDSGGER